MPTLYLLQNHLRSEKATVSLHLFHTSTGLKKTSWNFKCFLSRISNGRPEDLGRRPWSDALVLRPSPGSHLASPLEVHWQNGIWNGNVEDRSSIVSQHQRAGSTLNHLNFAEKKNGEKGEWQKTRSRWIMCGTKKRRAKRSNRNRVDNRIIASLWTPLPRARGKIICEFSA